MEPITLCGLVIVLFGLWVELEPALMRAVRRIRSFRLFTAIMTQPAAPARAYSGKMPVCLARSSHC
jgi:hypothetical protein